MTFDIPIEANGVTMTVRVTMEVVDFTIEPDELFSQCMGDEGFAQCIGYYGNLVQGAPRAPMVMQQPVPSVEAQFTAQKASSKVQSNETRAAILSDIQTFGREFVRARKEEFGQKHGTSYKTVERVLRTA